MTAEETSEGDRLRLGDPRVSAGLVGAVAAISFFSIAAMQILLGLAALNATIGWARGGGPPFRGQLLAPMIAFLAASLLSAAAAGSLESAREAMSTALAMLAYLLALNFIRTPAGATRGLLCVVASGTLAALLGLYQAAVGPHAVRVAGSLSHFYTYSGVVTVAAALAIGRIVFGARRRELAWLVPAALLMVAALLQTQTRAALVALVVACGLLLAMWRPRHVLWLPLAMVAVYFLSPEYVRTRIRSTVDSQDATVNERYEMWENGYRIWKDHPVVGIGPGRSPDVYPGYRDPESPFKDVPYRGHVHNNLIQIALERGALGVIAWLAIWIAWLVRSTRAYRRLPPGRSDARAALSAGVAAIVAFHVMGCFEYNFGDSEVATLAHFVLALPLVIGGAPLRAAATGRAGEPSPAAREPEPGSVFQPLG